MQYLCGLRRFVEFGIKKHFSISVPRSSYISEAFARFSCELSADEEFEVFYKETNAMRTLKNVLQDDYKLGILRYAENYDRYYKELVEEKGLRCELVAEFRYALHQSQQDRFQIGHDTPHVIIHSRKTGILFQYRKSIPHGAKKCHHLFLTCLSSYCHPAQRMPVIFAILPVVVPRAFVV